MLLVGQTTAQARKSRVHHLSPQRVICLVFKSHCSDALRVSYCESRFDVYAQNGQYKGLFQMGSNERATYDRRGKRYNRFTAWDESIAAHRYFVASGEDWSPWSCKPY